jgi:hypothetical protein
VAAASASSAAERLNRLRASPSIVQRQVPGGSRFGLPRCIFPRCIFSPVPVFPGYLLGSLGGGCCAGAHVLDRSAFGGVLCGVWCVVCGACRILKRSHACRLIDCSQRNGPDGSRLGLVLFAGAVGFRFALRFRFFSFRRQPWAWGGFACR